MAVLRVFMLPFAAFYGIATWIRNLLFDVGAISSKKFPIPVISIGNLNTGGTGKSPHIEYLAKLLSMQYNIAILSRGYRRKTRGFLQVLPTHQSTDVGDEPLMFSLKFPQMIVAVAESRAKGIEEIMKRFPEVNLILLDDAFQHRFVKPTLNILLTEYHRSFTEDSLLPYGNLREAKRGASRADILVVTKTPKIFPIMARKYFLEKLQSYKFSQVFFSSIHYGSWIHIKDGAAPDMNYNTLYLATGIAQTYVLEEYLRGQCRELIVNKFSDHYQFKEEDLKRIRAEFGNIIGMQKAIVMTEKDYMRLKDVNLARIIHDLPVFYIPMHIVLHKNSGHQFDEFVTDFLKHDSGNQSLADTVN